MAQISYGTITITDTNDIERIYVVYAKHTSNTDSTGLPANSSWTETISSAPGSGDYIWQMTVIKKTDIGTLSYSNPVCITGPDGIAAKNIIAVETEYGISADWNTEPVTADWSEDAPSYNSAKPKYWTRTRLKYEDNTYSSWVVSKNYALTESIYNSALANSISQSANENAQGAMSQAASNVNEVKRLWYAQAAATPRPSAPSTEVTTTATHDGWSITKPTADESYPYYFYCDQTKTGGGVCSWSEVILDTSTLSQYQIGALTTKVRNYWWDSAGAHIASGLSGSGEITSSSPSSDYGYNTLTGLTGISFRYNEAKVVDLNSTTPSLDFYQPPTISGNTVTEGKKTMMLSANALTFYDPTDGTTEQAVLDTNGLVLKKGGIEAGTVGENGYIYLSTINHPLSYIKTADTEIDSNKTYYTYNSNTDVYTEVETPTVSDINSYYELIYPSVNSVSKNNWRELIGTKFGVDSEGNLYASNANISGTITVNSGSNLSAGLGNYSTTADMNMAISTAADDVEAKTSYSVEIQVTAIDYVNNSATLVAIPYYQGSTTMPTGVTLSYQWYKNGTALSDTSTEPTINGVDTNTLQLGEGTDFGSSSTNAIYTCIIS